ncbi:MAG: condensation domain-containing protein, partial [Chloroflexota bacterium]|nr:condensation domain-containing protein [Chloroflexota bacterium]
RTVMVALDEHETHTLLYKVPGQYRARVADLLLTALAQTLTEWTGNQSLLVGLEGHGREEIREDVDLSRTIGWFTTFFPVTLTVDPAASAGAALKMVKEQVRRIPHRGMSYGLLRYLSPDPETRRQLAALPPPQVLFNYLGQSEIFGRSSAGFQRTEGLVGLSRHPRNRRLFLLEINAQVVAGRLQIAWAYSENLHHDDTIRWLAERYHDRLRLLIDHCLSIHTYGYTPSDFPLSDLGQSELDGVIAQALNIARIGNGRTGASLIDDLYPLSPMQELMLLHAVSTPHRDTLSTQIRYRLEGNVNVDALQHAWQALVDRHPALRTGFLWEHLRAPLQIVYRHVQLPFVRHDLRNLPPEARQAKLETIRQEDREQRFNPSMPPLMRITLIRLAEDRYELLWSSHHLILDRWCIDIVMRDVTETLATGDRDQDSERPPAPSFRNYIAWLQQQDQVAAEQFWRTKLAGFVGPTKLVPDPPVDPGQAAPQQYRESQIPIPASTFVEMRRFARQHHLTLNTLLQAAWALLLSRYSGERDVSFGVAVSGRPAALAGIESMMGSFVNNLPVRIPVTGADMLTWLKTIQQQMGELRQYEHSSLVRIQEWSGVAQRTSLFESLLIHQAHSGATTEWAGTMKIHSLPGHVRTNYPLTVLASEASDELSLSLIYDTHLFAPDTTARMGESLAATLEEIVAQPALPPSQLATLADAGSQVGAEFPVGGADPHRRKAAPIRAFGRKQKTYIAPKDILEHQLVKIWEMILETEPIGVQDNFFQLGGHSLLAIRLFAHLEDTFGTKLPATVLSQAATIEDLAEVMRREDAASLKPVVTFQARGAGRPLFYISPPGEAMLSYAYFVHHLGVDRPIYGLQPLGLYGEHAPYTRTEEMAAHFIREIRTIQPEGPYLLTGTCFGGMVAVEVARQLQAEGRQVVFLGLLDTPFPNPTLSSKIMWQLHSLRALEPKERLGYILERIKRRTARMVGAFYLKRKRALPEGLRDLYARGGVAQAANSYIPQHYQGRITLFRAEGAIDQSDADSVAWGWNQVATNGVDVHLVPGEHGTMMSEPHVHVLVEKFRASLAQLQIE